MPFLFSLVVPLGYDWLIRQRRTRWFRANTLLLMINVTIKTIIRNRFPLYRPVKYLLFFTIINIVFFNVCPSRTSVILIEELWQIFNSLRVFSNRILFRGFAEKLLSLYLWCPVNASRSLNLIRLQSLLKISKWWMMVCQKKLFMTWVQNICLRIKFGSLSFRRKGRLRH